MRILCLDVGSKTIGVAVSDPFGWTAQGVKTIERREILADCREIESLIRDLQVEKILVGLPLRMNGTEGDQAASVRAFVGKMEEHAFAKGTPVLFWDERFSTVAAERGLLEADLSREKRKKVINKMAAIHILQGFLDSQKDTLS